MTDKKDEKVTDLKSVKDEKKHIEKEEKPIKKEVLPLTAEYLEQIMAGTVDPPNDQIKYFANELKLARDAFQALAPQVDQREKDLNSLRQQLQKISFRLETVQLDISKTWPKSDQ